MFGKSTHAHTHVNLRFIPSLHCSNIYPLLKLLLIKDCGILLHIKSVFVLAFVCYILILPSFFFFFLNLFYFEVHVFGDPVRSEKPTSCFQIIHEFQLFSPSPLTGKRPPQSWWITVKGRHRSLRNDVVHRCLVEVSNLVRLPSSRRRLTGVTAD